ncbi:MAG: hypothetical protein SOU50_07890 [Oscillospiraceae bacterium]|nr:hypothetical protein [Oscillospiraceae bacterium]
MIDLINKYPYEIVFILIVIIIIATIKTLKETRENEKKRQVEKENEELKKILYRNKDFKGKPLEYYAETRRERLIRIFDEMDATDQRKLCDYAERMERDRENREYYK